LKEKSALRPSHVRVLGINNGHGFCSDIDPFLPPLQPKMTKAGKIAVRQPHIPTKPKEWWKAQCAFRSLALSGTVADMQNRLRASNGSMAPKLWHVQQQLNLDYLRSNAALREEQWLALESDQARVETDPIRLFREKLVDVPDGISINRVIVLKTYHYESIQDIAELPGLQTESTEVPTIADRKYLGPQKWVVVGKRRMAVSGKICELRRDAQRAQQRVKGAKMRVKS
jgi:hypothetical protein